MQAYAKTRSDAPELVDLVAASAEGAAQESGENGEGRSTKRQRIYEDHRAMSAITEGIKQGKYHQVSPSYPSSGGPQCLVVWQYVPAFLNMGHYLITRLLTWAINAMASHPGFSTCIRLFAHRRNKLAAGQPIWFTIEFACMAGRMQGTLRVDRFNSSEGWVASESVGQNILIPDHVAMNRAVDGDVVAVELLPEVKPQKSPSSVFLENCNQAFSTIQMARQWSKVPAQLLPI